MNTIQIQNFTINDLQEIVNNSVKEAFKENKLFTQKEPEDLLTTKQAMELLQVSQVTLHRWRVDGLIPSHRIGGSIYFKRSEIINSMFKES